MPKRPVSKAEQGTLLFLLALVCGGWFRFDLPAQVGFPVGDGGLFYWMVETLRSHSFRIPAFVQFNGLNIPFAYPPLGFYITGGMAALTGLPTLDVMRWLPACVTFLIIPAFFHFTLTLTGDRFTSGLAAFFYALLPGSLNWLLMGGGITRSFGQLFLLLAITSYLRMFRSGSNRELSIAIILSALVCLSHPEAALDTCVLGLLTWLFFGRTQSGFKQALTVAIGTLLLTAPWWLLILSRFGLTPILSASSTGSNLAVSLSVLFIPLSQEKLLPILAVLALAGMAAALAQRRFFLPVFYLIPFLIDPRNATNIYIIPLAILAAQVLSDNLLPTLARLEAQTTGVPHNAPLQSFAEKFLVGYIAICLLGGMFINQGEQIKRSITPETRNVFDWVRTHTPSNSTFIILTGQPGLLNDFTNEWFPALTQRSSLTTIQGTEWLPGNEYARRSALLNAAQRCQAPLLLTQCLKSNFDPATYDYILIRFGSEQDRVAFTQLPGPADFQFLYTTGPFVLAGKVP